MDAHGERLHAEAVRAFQGRLAGTEALEVVREMITHGSSAILDDQQYSKVRQRIGEALGISPNRDVFMVGSAKLGFSIKSAKRYHSFEDESDVDIAIVSEELYCALWSEIRKYNRDGGQWPSRDDRNHFRNDHVSGVIKPYVLPDSPTIPTRRRLFDISATLQRLSYSPYPVTIALWHNIEALEDYQAIAVRECQREMTS